ncbi:MAG: tyrosine-type recombinase/integrase [Candidatus Dormibacteria bacterium]
MSRRGNGEGSISHRPDGRWQAQVTVEGRRRVAYGRTREDAAARLQQLQHSVTVGLPVTPERLTVGAFAQGWLEGARPHLAPSTATRYAQLVNEQIVPTWGRLRLSKLRPEDVDAGLAKLQAGGLSPRSCSHVRAVLRTALNDGLRKGTVPRNVASLSSPPRVPYQRPKLLSPDEVQAVLDALDDPTMRRMVTVALATGLRQGELLGLRWQDVADGQLRVSYALQRVAGRYELVRPKSDSSRRSVPLTPDAVTALEDQRQAQRLAQLAAGGRWRPVIADLIFTTATGQPVNGPALTHRFEAALARAGLPVIRWHHLRHAFAGLLLASGVELATVSHLLGHSDVSLTASTYAGIAPSLRQDAMSRLGALLRRPV